jgi:hypothetical protein
MAKLSVKIFYSKPLIRCIALFYIRKRFLWKVARYIFFIVAFFLASIHVGLFSIKHGTTYRGLGYAVVGIGIAVVAFLEYRSIIARLERAHGSLSGEGVEFFFDDDKILIILGQKRGEILWFAIKRVCLSKALLILLTRGDEVLALPTTGLSAEVRAFLVSKLNATKMLSHDQCRLLSQDGVSQ